MLLTPICAHSLQHRPVVTAATQRITVRLDRDHAQKAMVSVDGGRPLSLRADRRSSSPVQNAWRGSSGWSPEAFFQ